ncbi:MAG TPA: phosphoribosylaminoimidazolesuccinocarboxamide synthase [Egibacteraceae bacterium]|nr:phosphoribosylaminoimidazolesuccinocarboxamide synthase [Egibacteraceae bacterium]
MDDLSSVAGVERIGSGKVRELYGIDGRLLLVATDRISAFDVVLPTPIPDKGKVLTGLTVFWLNRFADLVPNHLITTDPDEFPEPLRDQARDLAGRAMLCRRAEMLPVECVARGYLAGSGWKEYQVSGRVCGIPLPVGLKESSQLPEPIFTPATKATDGHDENITFEQASDIVGGAAARRLRDLTLDLYSAAHDHAQERGVLLADTKFEFGFVDGELTLCDEVLTPDSSRFWPADDYEPGRGQASYDKQIVRDWLETQGWDKAPPGPDVPEEIVQRTRGRYVEVYEQLTGQSFDQWAG